MWAEPKDICSVHIRIHDILNSLLTWETTPTCQGKANEAKLLASWAEQTLLYSPSFFS